MFEALSDRLNGIVRNLTGRGRLSEDNVRESLREVRRALLEADVQIGVARDLKYSRLSEGPRPFVYYPLLQSYALRLREDRRLGAQPVAFGVAGNVLGVHEDDAASALLLTSANAILQASMRLLPVSHRDVQGILHRARPQIVEMVEGMGRRANGQTGKVGVDLNEAWTALRSFQPLQEIASMRHARGNSRLFSS